MPPPNKKSKRADIETKVSPKGSSDAHVQRPAWPHMQLERPNDMLSLHHLMPAQIVTISNFWTAALCKRYVTFLSSLPLVTTPGVPKKGDAVRVNDRFQVDDPVFASLLWNSTGLRELILDKDTEQEGDKFWGGEVLGLNSNIRIYRYRKGQFFDQHYDDSNSVELPGIPPVRAKTTWTLLLYLTSSSNGCVGGETVFYPSSLPSSGKKSVNAVEPISVALETGMALLHKHGRDCMLHEGKEVLDGEKWVIRTVAYRGFLDAISGDIKGTVTGHKSEQNLRGTLPRTLQTCDLVLYFADCAYLTSDPAYIEQATDGMFVLNEDKSRADDDHYRVWS